MSSPTPNEQVAAPATPPAPRHHWTNPKLTPQQRIDGARDWLIRCQQEPTPTRMEQLAAYVGLYRPGSDKARIADTLVRRGQDPSTTAVNAILTRQRRNPRRPPISPADADLVIDWISSYWDDHGQGPLWRELATHFDWNRDHTSVVLWWLRHRRRVWFTSAARSLKPRVADPSSSEDDT